LAPSYTELNSLPPTSYADISGPGKYHDYDFYKVAGLAIAGKDKGEAENELPPVDLRDLMP
jgi:NADH-quinone oxidoreductase subunit I